MSLLTPAAGLAPLHASVGASDIDTAGLQPSCVKQKSINSRATSYRRFRRHKGAAAVSCPQACCKASFDTLEEPDPGEEPLTIDVGAPADQIAEEFIRLLGTSAAIGQSVARA
jgi:hypothetical protein